MKNAMQLKAIVKNMAKEKKIAAQGVMTSGQRKTKYVQPESNTEERAGI